MRRCAFCDKTKKLTLEHAWPDWSIQFARRDEPSPSRIRHAVGEGVPLRKYSGEVKTRRFCKDSNTGWMSELEASVCPILKEMMVGNEIGISKESCDRLALWAAKTAMVFDTLKVGPSGWFYVAEERLWLYSNRSPPPGTLVWIGLAAPGIPLAALGGEFGDDTPPLGAVRRHATHLVLRRVAFLVLSQRFCTHTPGRVHSLPGLDVKQNGYVQIWPSRSDCGDVPWPTSEIVIAPDEIERGIGRFSRP